MKIAIGSDHAGYEMKEKLKEALSRLGHEVSDLGSAGADPVDYPSYGRAVAEAVASGRAERGIAVCGSGVGMSIAANRVNGARAALAFDEEVARLSRRHNDTNVLCLGGRLTPWERAESIVRTWLTTPFDGGERHARRVEQLG